MERLKYMIFCKKKKEKKERKYCVHNSNQFDFSPLGMLALSGYMMIDPNEVPWVVAIYVLLLQNSNSSIIHTLKIDMNQI